MILLRCLIRSNIPVVFIALIVATVLPAAASAQAFSRANGGFGGYFESEKLARLQLEPTEASVRGLIDHDASGGEWRITAHAAADGTELRGEAVSGSRRLPWSAKWNGDALIARWDKREVVFHRTVPLSPALTNLKGPTVAVKRNRWTIAVYIGGDNNLEAAALADLREMRSSLPKDGVEIIALVDRAKGYSDEDGDWTDTRVLRVRPNDAPDVVLAKPGELDTGDAGTLASFLTGAFSAFPAERYAAIIWNHGGGWTGVVSDEEVPGQPGKTDMLNLIDVRVALRTAILHATHRPLDLLSFDACNMAQLEVALQVSDLARYMTASEAVEPGEGYPYERILPLFADSKNDARAVAVGIAEAYAQSYSDNKNETTTMAAFDLQAMPAVADALSRFAFLSEVFHEQYWPAVQRALFYAESYGARSDRLSPQTTPSIDVRDLVHRIADGLKPLPLDKWVKEVDAALDRAVLVSRNGDLRHRSRGLAIFGPRIAAQAAPHYAIAPLARESQWPALLATARTEAAKHSNEPIEFSDISIRSSVIDGVQVVRPFDADSILFTVTGHSIVEVLQIDQQRDGPGWVSLRKRWVPDPVWMKRVYEGATDVTDLFMPKFIDGENQLQVELTGQRFIVTDGTSSTNLTLDQTAPDHGSPIFSRAMYYAGQAKTGVRVEVAFDPIWWNVIQVVQLDNDPKIAPRSIQPAEGDRLAFILETMNDQDETEQIESAQLTWRGRGPSLLFSQDEPGDYRSIFVARTLDGRGYSVAVSYPVQENPAMAEWIESWKDVDLSRLQGKWYRKVMAQDGSAVDTHTLTTIGKSIGASGLLFEVDNEVEINGQKESLPQFWLFQPGPVPSFRLISPTAGSPDLCWYGPARLGQEGKVPWIAVKALQVGGVTWRWDQSIYDQLQLR